MPARPAAAGEASLESTAATVTGVGFDDEEVLVGGEWMHAAIQTD
jgi:hypothetical protein